MTRHTVTIWQNLRSQSGSWGSLTIRAARRAALDERRHRWVTGEYLQIFRARVPELLWAQLVRLDDTTWLDVLTWSRPDGEQRLMERPAEFDVAPGSSRRRPGRLLRTRNRLVGSSVQGAEQFAAFLDAGIGDIDTTLEEAEYRLLFDEVRISCTYGMLLCLSRPQRAAYLLVDVPGLTDTDGAEILGCTRGAFRQRVSRARRTCGG
jgi:hypothetical protein